MWVSFWIVLHLISLLNPEPEFTIELAPGMPSLHLPNTEVGYQACPWAPEIRILVAHRVVFPAPNPQPVIQLKDLEKQEQPNPN